MSNDALNIYKQNNNNNKEGITYVQYASYCS